jgi:hypothetical protein
MPDHDAQSLLQSPSLIEELASTEHERWSHWQRYLHEQCVQGADGSLTIPAHLVSHWTRQMNTPYAQLSEKEKHSDREQVQRYLPIIAAALAREDSGDA